MSTKRTSIVEVILWILVVFLVLLSLTPIALGFKVKSDYAAVVAKLSEMMQIDMQIQQYEQGLFSSDVTAVVNIPGLPEPLTFKEEVIHGPIYLGLINQGKLPLVAAVIKGKLHITPAQQQMARKFFADKEPLVYQAIVDFSGNIESQAYVPAIKTSFEDDMGIVILESSGAIINEYYDAASNQVKGELQLPVVKVSSELFSVNAESLSVSFSGTQGINQLMIGDSVLSMGLLNVDSGDDQFSVRDMTVRSVTSEQGALINSGAQLNAREVLASNQKFGPVKFNLSVNGLDAKSLLQLQDLQQDMEQKLQQGIPPEQINAMVMGQVMGLVPNLIKQAEIKINPLSISSELGKLEADMDFMLEGIDENTPADPMFLLGAISLDLNFSVDEQLLKQFVIWELQNAQLAEEEVEQDAGAPLEQQANENIQVMIDENWLVFNEGVYLTKISMHQGELLVNDKPVDPMQQIMSGMAPEGSEMEAESSNMP